MAKDVLIVKCNKNISFDEWDSVVNYIKSQVGNEYYVVGTLKGMDIECVTNEAKVFNIDGDNYSYEAIKKAIETVKEIEHNSTGEIEKTEEDKEVEENAE